MPPADVLRRSLFFFAKEGPTEVESEKGGSLRVLDEDPADRRRGVEESELNTKVLLHQPYKGR